jgi:hypothetical protein
VGDQIGLEKAWSRVILVSECADWNLAFEQGSGFGRGDATRLTSLASAFEQAVSSRRAKRQKEGTNLGSDGEIAVLFKHRHEGKARADGH